MHFLEIWYIIVVLTLRGENEMANVAVSEIKNAEQQASEIISAAHNEAALRLQNARAKASELIEDAKKAARAEALKMKKEAEEQADQIKEKAKDDDTVGAMKKQLDQQVASVIPEIVGELLK